MNKHSSGNVWKVKFLDIMAYESDFAVLLVKLAKCRAESFKQFLFVITGEGTNAQFPFIATAVKKAHRNTYNSPKLC